MDAGKLMKNKYTKQLCEGKSRYSLFYPDFILLYIPRRHLVFHDLQVVGEHFLSSRSRSQRSVAVMAYWGESTGSECKLKVGTIDYKLQVFNFNVREILFKQAR